MVIYIDGFYILLLEDIVIIESINERYGESCRVRDKGRIRYRPICVVPVPAPAISEKDDGEENTSYIDVDGT